MQIRVKQFRELTANELYEILKLRAAVFVVEQNCAYQDPDDLDQAAIHVWLEEDGGGIAAYLRVLDKGVESEHAAIGRVIAKTRRKGYGTRVLQAGIRAAKTYFDEDTVYLEAQTYAKAFYEKAGFRQISDEFLIDNIPHIQMELCIKRTAMPGLT